MGTTPGLSSGAHAHSSSCTSTLAGRGRFLSKAPRMMNRALDHLQSVWYLKNAARELRNGDSLCAHRHFQGAGPPSTADGSGSSNQAQIKLCVVSDQKAKSNGLVPRLALRSQYC
jgi:hypothetical protein